MDTVYKKADSQAIEEAAAIIRAGGLVAFPTETVYGLGANGLDEKAAVKIYAAKGRPSDNPLILHVSGADEVSGLVKRIPSEAEHLMEIFWPGPLTIIFPKSDCVPYATTGGLDTVAIRCPSDEVAAALIRQSGVPIAAPSANASGRPSPTNAKHVWEDMNGKIEMILDGGECSIGLESTIVDVTGEQPEILRPGFITQEMLEHALACAVTVDAAVNHLVDANIHPKAPGMKYRHYAPHAPLTLVEGAQEKVVAMIGKLVKEEKEAGKKVGVIGTDETLPFYEADKVISIGSRRQAGEIARNLYRVLRVFDDTDVDVIFSESFSGEGLGSAIMNRLNKAAGHHTISV